MYKMGVICQRDVARKLVVGLVAAGRLMRDLLYEIRPLDPAVFAVVAATLLAVAVFACIVSRVACFAP
jgi:hypothetical protein